VQVAPAFPRLPAMTGTGQSGGFAAARANNGPPPRFWQAFVGISIGTACHAWGWWELAGRFAWGALGAVIGMSLVLIWQVRRDRDRWAEQRAVDRALRDHRAPGPAYRAAADQRARARLAVPTGFAMFVVALIFGGPATACVVVAFLRGDPAVALPGIPLIALAFWLIRLTKREAVEAELWLRDPPSPRAGEEPP
jgi:hypothetical protein